MGNDILAVIPARGGSKRIPRKNVRPFCGRPLICWTIETALVSSHLSDIVVNTDDDEIQSIAEEMGVTVHRRPPELVESDELWRRHCINRHRLGHTGLQGWR